jgi:hypothetical protein
MVRVVPLVVSVTVTLVVLPVAINVATGGSLPVFLAPFVGWAWPAVGVLWLVATVLAVRELRRGDDDVGARFPEHPRNRENALDRVDRVVAQRLRNSLAEKVRIALELDERPDAVIRRSSLRVHAVGGGPVPPASSPQEAFRLLDESMLVLGAPGAGKTTMLLELAHSLVAKARSDGRLPVPVLVDLAGWSRPDPGQKDKRGFTGWLLLEVDRQYGIPEKVTKTWLSDGRLAMLFDGLDEVREADRDACVTELNQLQDRYLIPRIAVTSREHDYTTLTEQLRLAGAIVIRPLTQEQVLNYLEANDLTRVKAALDADPTLRELLNSPLMLNIMTLAFHGRDVPLSVHRRDLFDAYLTEVLSSRRLAPARYRIDQVVRWLRYLASTATGAVLPSLRRPRLSGNLAAVPPEIAAGMTRVFFPAAFGGAASVAAFWVSLRFGVLTAYALVVVGTVLLPLLHLSFPVTTPRKAVQLPMRVMWLLLGGCFGIAVGLSGLVLGELTVAWLASSHGIWMDGDFLFVIVTGLLARWWWGHGYALDRPNVTGTFCGLVIGSATFVLVWRLGISHTTLQGGAVGLGLGATLGVLTVLARTVRRAFGPDLAARSVLGWHQREMRFTAPALLLGAFTGATLAHVTGMHDDSVAWLLFPGFVAGLIIEPMVASSYPSQGVHLWTTVLLIRVPLILTGHMPLRRKRFLRYASDRIILVPADGQHRFVHALVRDHLTTSDPETLAAKVRQRHTDDDALGQVHT